MGIWQSRSVTQNIKIVTGDKKGSVCQIDVSKRSLYNFTMFYLSYPVGFPSNKHCTACLLSTPSAVAYKMWLLSQ